MEEIEMEIREDVKRKTRNLSEKKRRDQFNSLISELALLVAPTGNGRKMDKSTVLRATIAFFKTQKAVCEDQSPCDPTSEDLPVGRYGDNAGSSYKPEFLSYEEYTHLMLESLDGFMVATTTEGEILFVSESISSLLGYSPGDVIGKSVFSLIEEKDEETLKESIKIWSEDPKQLFTSRSSNENCFHDHSTPLHLGDNFAVKVLEGNSARCVSNSSSAALLSNSEPRTDKDGGFPFWLDADDSQVSLTESRNGFTQSNYENNSEENSYLKSLDSKSQTLVLSDTNDNSNSINQLLQSHFETSWNLRHNSHKNEGLMNITVKMKRAENVTFCSSTQENQTEKEYEKVSFSGYVGLYSSDKIESLQKKEIETSNYRNILPKDCYVQPKKKENQQKTKVLVGVVKLCHPPLLREMRLQPGVQFEFVSRHSLEWKFLFLDQRASSVIGFLPIEVLGTSGYDYYHADDLERISTSHLTLLKTGKGTSCYYRFLTKGQQWIWLQTSAYISYHQWNSKPEFVVCTNVVVSYDDIKAEINKSTNNENFTNESFNQSETSRGFETNVAEQTNMNKLCQSPQASNSAISKYEKQTLQCSDFNQSYALETSNYRQIQNVETNDKREKESMKREFDPLLFATNTIYRRDSSSHLPSYTVTHCQRNEGVVSEPNCVNSGLLNSKEEERDVIPSLKENPTIEPVRVESVTSDFSQSMESSNACVMIGNIMAKGPQTSGTLRTGSIEDVYGRQPTEVSCSHETLANDHFPTLNKSTRFMDKSSSTPMLSSHHNLRNPKNSINLTPITKTISNNSVRGHSSFEYLPNRSNVCPDVYSPSGNYSYQNYPSNHSALEQQFLNPPLYGQYQLLDSYSGQNLSVPRVFLTNPSGHSCKEDSKDTVNKLSSYNSIQEGLMAENDVERGFQQDNENYTKPQKPYESREKSPNRFGKSVKEKHYGYKNGEVKENLMKNNNLYKQERTETIKGRPFHEEDKYSLTTPKNGSSDCLDTDNCLKVADVTDKISSTSKNCKLEKSCHSKCLSKSNSSTQASSQSLSSATKNDKKSRHRHRKHQKSSSASGSKSSSLELFMEKEFQVDDCTQSILNPLDSDQSSLSSSLCSVRPEQQAEGEGPDNLPRLWVSGKYRKNGLYRKLRNHRHITEAKTKHKEMYNLSRSLSPSHQTEEQLFCKEDFESRRNGRTSDSPRENHEYNETNMDEERRSVVEKSNPESISKKYQHLQSSSNDFYHSNFPYVHNAHCCSVGSENNCSTNHKATRQQNYASSPCIPSLSESTDRNRMNHHRMRENAVKDPTMVLWPKIPIETQNHSLQTIPCQSYQHFTLSNMDHKAYIYHLDCSPFNQSNPNHIFGVSRMPHFTSKSLHPNDANSPGNSFGIYSNNHFGNTVSFPSILTSTPCSTRY